MHPLHKNKNILNAALKFLEHGPMLAVPKHGCLLFGVVCLFFFILNVSIIHNMIIKNSKIIGKRQVSELQISEFFVKLG